MAGLEGVVNEKHEKLVEGYIALAKEQIRTDYDIQTRDIADRLSHMQKEFDKVRNSSDEAEPKKGYFAKIIGAAKTASGMPILSFVSDTSKFLGGIFYEVFEKIANPGIAWYYEKKMAKIKWAEDEIESLNEIGKEIKALAEEVGVGLSYGNGAFGVETGNTAKNKVDEFFNRAESIGFAKKDDLLYLPGYQKLVKFMVKNSKKKRLSFLKRDDDSIRGDRYEKMFWIENLEGLKEKNEYKKTKWAIRLGLKEEQEELKDMGNVVEKGYVEIQDILQSADFRDYLKRNIPALQGQMGDAKQLLTDYVYGGSSMRRWKQYGLPVVGAFSKWLTGIQLKNDKKDIDSALNTLRGSDIYAILTKEQLKGRLSGKGTMANILNALPDLKDALAEKCDENGLIALKIDNALTKEMSDKGMDVGKEYHNIVRVPLFGIAHHFDAGADRKELLKKINQDVRVVDIYHEIDSLAKNFKEWYSGLGFEHELTDDRGILRLFSEIKEDFKERKRELTLDVFKGIINGGLESHMDGVTSIYRSKARKFVNNYIEGREKREREFEDALDFFVDKFDNLFSISAYDSQKSSVIADNDLEGMIGKEVVSKAKNLIVDAYGRHSFVHSIQTMRAEKVQGVVGTVLFAGLLYKVVEEIFKSTGAAMFVGANFDDAFAGFADGVESVTGTAIEKGKRVAHTAVGGLTGIGVALLAGLYFFQKGDMPIDISYIKDAAEYCLNALQTVDLNLVKETAEYGLNFLKTVKDVLMCPEVVKHGIALGGIAAAGSLGSLTGNTQYYKESYSLLQEEGRMLPYVTDENGKSLKKKLELPFGELRTGFDEETTRPFIHGMFYIGVPVQMALAILIALTAHYTGHHEILHNPASVAMIGFCESMIGYISMRNARKALANWTKGLNVKSNGNGLEGILKHTEGDPTDDSTPAASA